MGATALSGGSCGQTVWKRPVRCCRLLVAVLGLTWLGELQGGTRFCVRKSGPVLAPGAARASEVAPMVVTQGRSTNRTTRHGRPAQES